MSKLPSVRHWVKRLKSEKKQVPKKEQEKITKCLETEKITKCPTLGQTTEI